MQLFKIKTDGVFIADIGLSKTEQGRQLLLTQTEKEIAIQERETWAEKQKAEVARAATVRAKTEADQEAPKAEAVARIEIEKANAQATIEQALGRAEAYTKQIEAVGGFDNFVTLEVSKLLTAQWKGEVPSILVTGNAGDGLSTSLIAKMLRDESKK